jgi:hypothetical protein
MAIRDPGVNQGPTWSDVANALQISASYLDQRGKLNLYLASQLGYLDAMVWSASKNQINTNFVTNEHGRSIAGFQNIAGVDDANSWMNLISDSWVKDSVRRLLICPRVTESVIKKIPNRRYVAMHCVDLANMFSFCNPIYVDKMQTLIDYQNHKDFSVALLDLGTAYSNQDPRSLIDRFIGTIDSVSRFEKNNEWLQDPELRREFYYEFSRELSDQTLISNALGEISLDFILYRFSHNNSPRELWVSHSSKFRKKVAARVVRASERDTVKNFTARMPVELIDKFKRVEMSYALTREQLLEVLIEGCLSGRINIQNEADQMRVKIRRKYAVVDPVPVMLDGANPTEIASLGEDGVRHVDSFSRGSRQTGESESHLPKLDQTGTDALPQA